MPVLQWTKCSVHGSPPHFILTKKPWNKWNQGSLIGSTILRDVLGAKVQPLNDKAQIGSVLLLLLLVLYKHTSWVTMREGMSILSPPWITQMFWDSVPETPVSIADGEDFWELQSNNKHLGCPRLRTTALEQSHLWYRVQPISLPRNKSVAINVHHSLVVFLFAGGGREDFLFGFVLHTLVP